MEPDGAGLGAKRAAAVIARIVAALDVPVSAGMAIAAVLNALTTRTSRPSPDPIASTSMAGAGRIQLDAQFTVTRLAITASDGLRWRTVRRLPLVS